MPLQQVKQIVQQVTDIPTLDPQMVMLSRWELSYCTGGAAATQDPPPALIRRRRYWRALPPAESERRAQPGERALVPLYRMTGDSVRLHRPRLGLVIFASGCSRAGGKISTSQGS